MNSESYLASSSSGGHVVLGLVVLDDGLDLVVLDGLVGGDQLVDGPGVDRGAEHALGLGLVALGHGHVAHVVAPAHDLHVVGGIPAGAGTGPGGDLLGDLGVGVVADHDLAVDAQAGDDVAELTVAMGGLVQVHEVHVDGLPRDLHVMLGVQLQHRLGEHFQAADPHLGRGEGVAPGDHADDVRVGRGLDHELLDAVGGLQRGLEDDLDRDGTGGVQVVDDLGGLLGDLTQCLLAVQVLRADAEPDFLALERVCHNHSDCSFVVLVGFISMRISGRSPRGCTDVPFIGRPAALARCVRHPCRSRRRRTTVRRTCCGADDAPSRQCCP